MLKAKHNLILDPFIRWFVIRKMKRSFDSIYFKGELTDRGKPVLLICNHVSWWDGIWALHFNQQFLHRKFYFMMLEEQLRKNWFFNYTGGFSVKKKSRSIIETIEYTAGLLNYPKNMVLLFPQGEIQSMHLQEYTFEKGIEKILQKIQTDIQIVFLANIVDYFSNAKPSLYSCFKEFSGDESGIELQNQYNRFYAECVESQKKINV
jgi:hypothetical protein